MIFADPADNRRMKMKNCEKLKLARELRKLWNIIVTVTNCSPWNNSQEPGKKTEEIKGRIKILGYVEESRMSEETYCHLDSNEIHQLKLM